MARSLGRFLDTQGGFVIVTDSSDAVQNYLAPYNHRF